MGSKRKSDSTEGLATKKKVPVRYVTMWYNSVVNLWLSCYVEALLPKLFKQRMLPKIYSIRSTLQLY